jgi:hypothetical protein
VIVAARLKDLEVELCSNLGDQIFLGAKLLDFGFHKEVKYRLGGTAAGGQASALIQPR